MKDKEIIAHFGYQDINVLKFYFDLTPPKNEIKEKPTNIEFDLSIKHGADRDKKQLFIYLDSGYKVNIGDKKHTLMYISTQSIFFIKNFSEVIMLKDDNISMPETLLNSLVSLSYSTTRGIIFEKVGKSLPILPPLPLEELKKVMQKS